MNNSQKIYDCAGAPSIKEYNNLGCPTGNIKIGAVRTGEFRCPRREEWFISGAVPEAYKAPNDLSMEYHIAKLVNYKK